MNIQIIGIKSCNSTKKAIRYFKERRLPVQIVDLQTRELSEGEWKAVFSRIHDDELINREGAFFKKHGYEYREYDPREEVKEHPQLLKTPVVRAGKNVTVGYMPDTWESWIGGEK